MESLGPYLIQSELGRGAMGVVYRARRQGLDRDVALKVLPAGSTEELAARFRREAQLAARLRHPNVVGVHNVGEEGGRLYLAMDLIEGVALDTFLEEERFTPVQAARLLIKLAEAVGHAHQEGVLHRDIKPGNILLSSNEKGTGVSQDAGITPFLADFGLARAIDTAGSEKLSRSGSVLGTPAYMSPEQAQGADIDGRTDLWALGVVGYELVSNRTPFQGDSAMQMLGQVCSKDPPPLRKVAPGVPRDFEAIIHRCLEKKRDQRYRVAADLVDDLQRFLDGQPVAARRVTVARRAAAWVRRNKAIAATALVGCLGIGAVAGYAFVLQPRWAAEARAAYLTKLQATVEAAVVAHAKALDGELRALAAAGAAGGDRVAAVETAARPEAMAAAVRESLPAAMRPAPDDTEAAKQFERGMQVYNAAPLQARAALLRGEPALAYRLDPAGDAGLEAAVQVAQAMYDERRLGPAAAILSRLRSRFPDRPVAKRASALLAKVLVEQGNWDQAQAAAADAGSLADLPDDTRALLQHLGAEQQRLPLVARGSLPFHYIRRAEPLREATLSDGRRLLLVPQRPGSPTFRIGDGTLTPTVSPATVFPSGTRIVDCAAGDVDGDGTIDLLCAAVRPGYGNGVLAVTPDGDGWRLLGTHLLPASTPAHFIPGDLDGDGRIEACVPFHWDSGEQWIVDWDPKRKGFVHVAFAPPASRPWIRGGAIADLDGDGTAELVVGTSLHTSGEGLVYHWNGRGAPQLRARFRVWEPGDFQPVPDPQRPGKLLLMAMYEVGMHDLAYRHSAHKEDSPPNDGVLFLQWDGAVMTEVRRYDISQGDPDTTYLGNIAVGRLLGKPAVAFWADRTRPDKTFVTAEGRRLRLILGDPTGVPLNLAPPKRVEAVELIDLDGDGESELIGLTASELYVRGRRTGAPPTLAIERGEEPTRNEALQRLRAARDLAASGEHATAETLLREVAQRFPGSPEAAEADRLRVDAQIAGARKAVGQAEQAVRAGAEDGEPRYQAAMERLRDAATEAQATGDRYAGDLARRRRFLLQAAEAWEQALEWERARRCLDAVLHESRGSDDDRTLVPRRRGLRDLERLYAPGAPSTRLDGPDVPLVASLPGRVTILEDGGWNIGVDSHRQRGVIGVPMVWRGAGMRGRCTLEIFGSAWAAGVRIGLVPRKPQDRWRGRTYIRVWMHGVTQWDDQGVSMHMEGGAAAFRPGIYSGRYELEWAFLPEANLVLYDVRDPETGRVLHRSRGTAPREMGEGDFVLGVLLADPMGDAYLSHSLHPWLTHITIRDLEVWGVADRLRVQQAEPQDAVEATEAGGGWLLRGELDEAAQRFERALGADPGAVRARLLLAVTRLRSGDTAAAGRHMAHALQHSPYHAVTILEDMGRAAPAAWRHDIGRCLGLALTALDGRADSAGRLARAAALSLRGELAQADRIVAELFAAGEDGTALRYVRRRTHWGDQARLTEDWSWLSARRALIPGTEPPVLCWSPGEGETLQTAREAMAAAWRELAQAGTLRNAMRVWIASSRVLILAPRDPSALMIRARLGIALRKYGLAEVDLKHRAAALADDPNAAFLVAQIYAGRRGTRDTLQWLEEAARRGLRWNDVEATTRRGFEFLKEHPRFSAFLERTGGK